MPHIASFRIQFLPKTGRKTPPTVGGTENKDKLQHSSMYLNSLCYRSKHSSRRLRKSDNYEQLSSLVSLFLKFRSCFVSMADWR